MLVILVKKPLCSFRKPLFFVKTEGACLCLLALLIIPAANKILSSEPHFVSWIRTIMESKESSYRPLMSSDEARDSVTDDSGSSMDGSLLDRYQSRRRWQRWVPSPILGSVIVLIFLTIGLIITILTHKPTDLQCTKQLSMYCESGWVCAIVTGLYGS